MTENNKILSQEEIKRIVRFINDTPGENRIS